MVELVEKYFV